MTWQTLMFFRFCSSLRPQNSVQDEASSSRDGVVFLRRNRPSYLVAQIVEVEPAYP